MSVDAKTLEARLQKARTFEHEADGITFRCRLPPHIRLTAIHSAHEGQAGGWVPVARAIVEESVIGVRGATTKHLGLDGEDAPLDDSADVARLLLDDRTDIMLSLAAEIGDRARARRDAVKADEGN